MIPRNAVPTSHTSPRPPIDINPRVPVTPGPGPYPSNVWEYAEAIRQRLENDRTWALVRGAAEGSNITAAPITEVCTDGWEAA